MALCKLGAYLAELSATERALTEARIASDSLREVASNVLAGAGVTVGRETVRMHRARLCACYTLREAVEPTFVDVPGLGISDAYVFDRNTFAPEHLQGREFGPMPDGPLGVITRDELMREANIPRRESSRNEESPSTTETTDTPNAERVLVGSSRWQKADGTWLESQKYEYVRSRVPKLDYDDLAQIITDYTAPGYAYAESARSDSAFVVPVGDLQLGKPDGDGTAGTIARFCEKTLDARNRMLRLGVFEHVVLPWLGDCIEGSVSQSGKLDLDIGVSEQLRLLRRLMLFQIETFAPHCTELIVPVVPGNHDETRRDRHTHGTDSWAIEGASAVADALQLNREAFGHVKFLFPPRGELSFAVNIAGTQLGLAHGHQWKPGNAESWLAGQSLGRQAVGECDVLLSAHLHHMRAQQIGDGRLWLQVPALDGGSDWFRQTRGGNVPGGIVSFVVKDGSWSELSVH